VQYATQKQVMQKLDLKMKDKIILRVLLAIVALTGLFAIFVPFTSWDTSVRICSMFGISDLPKNFGHPYMEYLVFMMAGVSIVYGYLFLLAAINPVKYRNVLPFLGCSLLFIGAIITYHGIRLGLPAWPFYVDPPISFGCGFGILYYSRKIKI
jgi:hypothetical protein